MESTIILGDLNAKIGKQQPDDAACMGQHGKGIRSENGDALRMALLSKLSILIKFTIHSKLKYI